MLGQDALYALAGCERPTVEGDRGCNGQELEV